MEDFKSKYNICKTDITEASHNIAGIAQKTPIMSSESMNVVAGRQLHFKCENLQRSGSFKIRGATNAIVKLCRQIQYKWTEDLPEDKIPVIVTHSSGNHAQAVALAAQTFHLKAKIVMPTNAPICKRAAVDAYGAEIISCEPTCESRESTAHAILAELGPRGYFIPPFDHLDVIAGQGTIGLEIMQQMSSLDAIIVPVGGGGMLSGIALAIKSTRPFVKVIAAEPANANDCSRSYSSGERIPLSGSPDTVADGLRTSVGEITWPIIRDLVDDVIEVTEEEIVSAMRLTFQRMKLVIEPSAAVSVAVAMSSTFRTKYPETKFKNVAVILCGGNVDLDRLPWTTTQN